MPPALLIEPVEARRRPRRRPRPLAHLSADLVTSPAPACTSPPAVAIAVGKLPRPRRRWSCSAAATEAPCAAKARASAAPMPVEAPVIRTALPARSGMVRATPAICILLRMSCLATSASPWRRSAPHLLAARIERRLDIDARRAAVAEDLDLEQAFALVARRAPPARSPAPSTCRRSARSRPR